MRANSVSSRDLTVTEGRGIVFSISALRFSLAAVLESSQEEFFFRFDESEELSYGFFGPFSSLCLGCV